MFSWAHFLVFPLWVACITCEKPFQAKLKTKTDLAKFCLDKQTLDVAASLEVNILVHEHASVTKDVKE